jgi:hypothetical protein
LACKSHSYLDPDVFPGINIQDIKFDLWTQNLCYRCALVNGRQLFCSHSGRVPSIITKFCFTAIKSLDEFKLKYQSVNSTSSFPEGLICTKSLKTIHIKNLMKLKINKIEEEELLDEPQIYQLDFRKIFTSILEQYSGDYISKESDLKLKYLENKELENEERRIHGETRSCNLKAVQAFEEVSEVFKIIFEELVAKQHADNLKALFGIGDDQELYGNIIPNFITFFLKTRFNNLLREQDVFCIIQDVLIQKGSKMWNTEFQNFLIWLLNENEVLGREQRFSVVVRDAMYSHAAGGKGQEIGCENGLKENITPQKDQRAEEESALKGFEEQGNELKYTCIGSYKNMVELVPFVNDLLPNNSGNKNDSSSEEEDDSENQRNPIKEERNIQDFQMDEHTETQVVRQIKCLEILKNQFLRAILEYHRKKIESKKTKKERLRLALNAFGLQIHASLMEQLNNYESGLQTTDQRRCVLCDKLDSHVICGRLIHFKKAEWIHVNCALWSEGTIETNFGGLTNIYQIVKKAKTMTCPECGLPGPSVSGHSDPNKKYHLICALKNKCVFTFNQAERRVTSLETWIKTNMSVYTKHFKHSKILFFIFTMSMEMITSFECPRRVYIIKKNLKGLISESVKTDCLIDLSSSMQDFIHKYKTESEESKGSKVLMSRVGNLLLLSVKDIVRGTDFHKMMICLNKMKHLFLQGLRKEGGPVCDEYTLEKKELFCILLSKIVTARVVQTGPVGSQSTVCKVYEFNCDITKANNLFSITIRTLSAEAFVEQMTLIYEKKLTDFDFQGGSVVSVAPGEIFATLYNDMGLNLQEMRAYLYSFVCSSSEKFKQNQLNMKNYLHYQHLFYQSSSDQHLFLDMAEKHSIYDRIKLLWQINQELCNSKDFLKDHTYRDEKLKTNMRSKNNPKSRSFNKRMIWKMSNSDNYRMSEKLIIDVINPTTSCNQEACPTPTKNVKRKLQGGPKSNEKGLSILKRGYYNYKHQNTIVAPSKIHKYGTVQLT